MSNEWKLKLLHSGQALSMVLNVIVLVIVGVSTGVETIHVLRVAGAIIAIDLVAEVAKLFLTPPNVDPKRSRWDGAARSISVFLNGLSLVLIFFPVGMTLENNLRTIGVIVTIDLVVEVYEWIKMK